MGGYTHTRYGHTILLIYMYIYSKLIKRRASDKDEYLAIRVLKIIIILLGDEGWF